MGKRFDCAECGMNVEATEFHPYWHCVLFRNGVDPRKIEFGPRSILQDIAADDLATADVDEEAGDG